MQRVILHDWCLLFQLGNLSIWKELLNITTRVFLLEVIGANSYIYVTKVKFVTSVWHYLNVACVM